MYVLVNCAASADGKLSTRRREQVAISGPEDFARVDRMRAESDAVAVGIGTVLADDPRLAVDDPERRAGRRERGEPANPVRVVVDSRARTPTDARILDDAATTYVLASEVASEEEIAALTAAGAEIVVAGEDRVDLVAALRELGSRGIERLMVEGGGELIFSLFADELVDELSVFVGPMIVGGRDAPTVADGEGFLDPGQFSRLELVSMEPLDSGVLLTWEALDRGSERPTSESG